MSRDSAPSLLSATAVMAAGTVISRVTGLIRAVMLVAAIGLTGAHADAFNVSNTIPNALYILLAGGIFNAVLVPQLVRAMKNDPDNGDAYANRIITLAALVLGAVTALLVIFAPLVLRIYAQGAYFNDPSLNAETHSMIVFARLCLPQIFFYGMFVLLGQILNARGRFGPMMWAPIANNLVAIAIIGLYLAMYADMPATGGYTGAQELLLGVGSTVGIICQFVLLLPYLKASGFKIRLRLDLRGTGLGHTLRLGMWTVGFVVVNQIAYAVMSHRATAATAASPEGAGLSVYTNAFLLTQVPHSIITVSLVTAVVPTLSRYAADHRVSEMSQQLVGTLRLVLSAIVPFVIWLLVLGPIVASVIFGFGAGHGETHSLGLTLIAFAPGMLMLSIHYTVLRGFYAVEDTRTVFLIQCCVSAVNIALAISLTVVAPPAQAAPMLAVAYASAYTVGALVSFTVFSRRVGGLSKTALWRYIGKVLVAALPAAAAAWVVVKVLQHAGLETGVQTQALAIAVAGGIVALVVYLGLARVFRITEINDVVATVGARLRRG